MSHQLRRWAPVAVVAVTLTALGWAVASVELSVESAPPLDLGDPPSVEETTSEEEEDDELAAESGPSQLQPGDHEPHWLGDFIAIAAMTLFFGAIVGLGIYALYRWLTTRPTGWEKVQSRAATQPDVEELRQAVAAGLADIDAGGDTRAAVVGCWLRLERAAAAAGVARAVTETPSELARRVLSECHVDERALTSLMRAYHQARYAPHDVTVDTHHAARAALAAVAEQLDAAAAAKESAS